MPLSTIFVSLFLGWRLGRLSPRLNTAGLRFPAISGAGICAALSLPDRNFGYSFGWSNRVTGRPHGDRSPTGEFSIGIARAVFHRTTRRRTKKGSNMSNCAISPEVANALKGFYVTGQARIWSRISPGHVLRRVQRWSLGRGRPSPYGPIEIAPGARALHYGEFVFEGMKAYRAGRIGRTCFAPDDNFERLARSAERLAMPLVPKIYFSRELMRWPAPWRISFRPEMASRCT
jgi:hypothetical protein